MANDLVVERAIFEDTTGSLSLAQVQDASFTPAPKVIFKGYSRSAFWIRLAVEVPVGSGPLSVRIQPTVLDSVTLFYPADVAGDPEIELDMGARSAQKDTRIVLEPGMNTVFLRVKSIGIFLIKTQVLTLEKVIQQDLEEFLELGAILAVYAVMALAMLGLLWVSRDSVGFFLLFHALVCVLLYVLIFGVFDNLQFVDWVYGKTAARLVTLVNFLSLILLMQALQGRLGWPRLQRWARFAAVVFVLLIVLFFVTDRHLVLKFGALFGSLTTIALMSTFWIMAFDFFRNQSLSLPSRLIAGLVGAAFFVFVCRSLMQVLGVMEDAEFLLRSAAWRGVFVPMVILAIQGQRDRVKAQELVQQQIAQAVSEAQLKEQSKRMATQAQFLAMLMHEVKTPLSIIQLAVASMYRHRPASSADAQRLDNIARAADDLNFIIDQCMQAEKVDQSDVPANKMHVSLRSLVSELKQIPGHERVTWSGIGSEMVLTDFQYARIILSNLVTNALKYSPPESWLQLHVEPTPWGGSPGLTLRLSNLIGSAGRPDPMQVFTRYYRAEGAKKQVGAGLGLWLAHQLATKLGTELRCSCDDELVHFELILEQP
jgi:signal transduction histidine kinase